MLSSQMTTTKTHIPNNSNTPQAPLVFLVGMPGVGKTLWGRSYAQYSGRPFIDLDEYIEAHIGLTIPAIMDSMGATEFRRIEQEQLQELINSAPPGAIIACGGGTPCFYNNIDRIKQAGIVIYLSAPSATLLSNISLQPDQRPLFAATPLTIATLDNLLEQRRNYYEQAHHILQVADISLATFDEILGHV